MAENEKKPNQTEEEFFAVATVGRRGLEEMTDKMGGEIMEIAAKSVADSGSTWMKRAVVAIANDEKLADVLKTKTGLFSIYKGLAKAATMGLQIGGQFPQAYLMGYGGKAELIVSAEGFKHTATHGPGAVLSDMVIRRVYEGEDFALDFAENTVRHSYDGKAERGKLVGVYGIMTRTDGERVVDYMTKAEAIRIRDAHSSAWKAGRATPWKSDEDAMVEKTAAKKFLRKYAAEAEGLAMLYGQDDDVPEAESAPVTTPRDVSDRMAAYLDRKAERASSVAKPAEAAAAEDAEIVTDSEPTTETEKTTTGSSGAPVELF